MSKILGQEKVKKSLEVAIAKNTPVLLVGETGCGKTSVVRELAAKHKRTFSRFNMTGETSVDEFVGKYTLINSETVWQDGILIKAMKEGHWLVVDEINVALPEVLLIMNSLLDDDRAVTLVNHDGERIECHDNFRFFGTMNPTDEYAGTKELNKAFLSRFGMVLEMSYPSAEVETRILTEAGVDEKYAPKMVDFATHTRRLKKEGKLFYTCSTRDLLHWGAVIEELGLQRAFEVAVQAKATGDQDALVEAYKYVLKEWEKYEKMTRSLNVTQMRKDMEELSMRRIMVEREERNVKALQERLNNELAAARKKELKAKEEIRKEVLAEVGQRLKTAVQYVAES